MSCLNESVVSKKLSPEEEEREQRRQMMDELIDESRVYFEESMISILNTETSFRKGPLFKGSTCSESARLLVTGKSSWSSSDTANLR